MAFIELLRPNWALPDATNSNLLILELVPPSGMAQNGWMSGNSRFLGRMNKKAAGFTSIETKMAPTNHFGTADTGLEAGGGLDLANTTAQLGSATWVYPFIRLRIVGSSGDNESAARLVLCLDGPVARIPVHYAHASFPYLSEGDDLLDPRHGLTYVP